MTWDRLRVFAAVAEHGSISAAAETLHLTGPAVSQHLRKLEAETGSRLIERDGRGIRLTATGQVLAVSARAVAATIAEAERDLATAHGDVVGPLRIGSIASPLRALIPGVLNELTAAHPRLEPSLVDGEAVDMIPALRMRRLDAVVMESWSNRPTRMPSGVRLDNLIAEDIDLAVHDGHRFADREVVALHELSGETWTSCPQGTDAHDALVQALRTENIDVSVPYCVIDYVSQMSLVAAGSAVAMVPRMAQEPAPRGIRFVRCRPSITRSIGVATATDTRAVRAFVHSLRGAANPPS